MNQKEIDNFNIEDVYDLNVFVGKLMQKYDIHPLIKDLIKAVAREAFIIGNKVKKETE